MPDLIIQFARLWGQREAWGYSAKDQEIADVLKTYDSEELQQLLQSWADEYVANEENEDTVDFFEKKVEELCFENSLENTIAVAFCRSETQTQNDRPLENKDISLD